ncbi:hypothetical protein D3C86_1408030 [compost metagenome]
MSASLFFLKTLNGGQSLFSAAGGRNRRGNLLRRIQQALVTGAQQPGRRVLEQISLAKVMGQHVTQFGQQGNQSDGVRTDVHEVISGTEPVQTKTGRRQLAHRRFKLAMRLNVAR